MCVGRSARGGRRRSRTGKSRRSRRGKIKKRRKLIFETKKKNGGKMREKHREINLSGTRRDKKMAGKKKLIFQGPDETVCV